MNKGLDIKGKLCLELEFDDVEKLNRLSFSALSEVLGGRVTRADFQGSTFDECDFYQELLDGEQMSFLLNRDRMAEATLVIHQALEKLIEEIEFDENLDDDEEDVM
ncbi:hypothetical protein EIM44_04275 [Bibersteinia trehalosi]|uniref:Uncharacterized protein n=1 Tax=Bibersteinia trehalosi TaxID=47735 RepID=A0A3R8LCE5_BIBTR|nr:hypothetical protein [Bibersteinia trehalosi]RRN04664.1 hypothetical protein EIM44_04275 [Bibersteinia trehalosi]